jgi:signal transduction histidine kinase
MSDPKKTLPGIDLPPMAGPKPNLLAGFAPLRGERRFLVNQPADLFTPEFPDRKWQAHIRDISRRGMQVVVDEPVVLGAPVRILWKGRTIHGTIRHQKQHENEYRLGIELSSSWESLVSEVLGQQAEELRTSNAALRHAEAEVMAYASALSDKNAELEKALQAAREASELKNRFFASVSHELRTPLNCIIGFSQLLHDSVIGPINDEQKECLGDMLSSADRLLGLIEEILDLTKLESGKAPFYRESIALDRLVGETSNR